MIGKKYCIALSVLVLLTAGSAVLAHNGATGIVKERMEAMKSIAGATKGIAKLDWSDVGAARMQATKHAVTLQKHAADINRLFPEGSIMGPSEAIPAIWDRPAEFAKIAAALEKAASDFSAVAANASSKEEILPQFEAIGATCKACHEDFRKKK